MMGVASEKSWMLDPKFRETEWGKMIAEIERDREEAKQTGLPVFGAVQKQREGEER